MMKSLFDELEKVYLQFQEPIFVSCSIVASLEHSYDEIVTMFIEKMKNEIEGADQLSGEQLRYEARKELEDLLEALRKNKMISRRLAEKFKTKMDSIKIKNEKNLETLVFQNQQLLQTVFSDMIVDFEILEIDFRRNKDEKTAEALKKILFEIEEFRELFYEISALFEINFDWDFDIEIERDFESIESIFDTSRERNQGQELGR